MLWKSADYKSELLPTKTVYKDTTGHMYLLRSLSTYKYVKKIFRPIARKMQVVLRVNLLGVTELEFPS